MKNADKPIIPLYDANGIVWPDNDDYIEQCKPLVGLSKREYFAGLAMQGILSRVHNSTQVANFAVKCADKLLEELEK